MRIISGTHRGRTFSAVEGTVSRPTADRVREALFNILYGKVTGSRVLDCFAGSGGLSFEALSRGASGALCIEKDTRAAMQLKKNAQNLQLDDRLTLQRGDFFACSAQIRQKFDLIFLDPPYNTACWMDAIGCIIKYNLLAAQGVIVCEHPKQFALPDEMHSVVRTDQRTYGTVCLSFYRRMSENETVDLSGEF